MMRRLLAALRSFLTPIRLLLAFAITAFFWFLLLGDQGAYKLVQLLRMKEQLIAKQGKISADIESLTEEQALLNDPKKLEMVLRHELGVIKPGEVIFQPDLSADVAEGITEAP